MQKELKQISFKRMNDVEFKVYSKWSVKAYAEHLIKSGDEKFRFKALKAAKSEFNDIFPDGTDSNDNYLYIVINSDNEKIGVIGYQKSPFEENAAFVTENVIKEEYRGKGYASQGLKLLINEIRDDVQEDEIYLRVNRDNPASLKVMLNNGGYIHHQDDTKYYVRIKR